MFTYLWRRVLPIKSVKTARLFRCFYLFNFFVRDLRLCKALSPQLRSRLLVLPSIENSRDYEERTTGQVAEQDSGSQYVAVDFGVVLVIACVVVCLQSAKTDFGSSNLAGYAIIEPRFLSVSLFDCGEEVGVIPLPQ